MLGAVRSPRSLAAGRRVDGRHDLVLVVPVRGLGDGPETIFVSKLSQNGFRAEIRPAVAGKQTFEIILPHVGRISAEVVWTEGELAGCAFLAPLTKGAVSAALLNAQPRAAPQTGAAPEGVLPVAEAGDTAQWPDEKKFPAGVRLGIALALALASWALVVTAYRLLT